MTVVSGTPLERNAVMTTFPLWLQGHVYADCRDERQYFITAFDLILSLYEIAPHEKAVADLRDSLRESEMR